MGYQKVGKPVSVVVADEQFSWVSWQIQREVDAVDVCVFRCPGEYIAMVAGAASISGLQYHDLTHAVAVEVSGGV